MDIISVFRTFPPQADCLAHLEKVKWDNIPTCPCYDEQKSTKEKTEKGYNIHCYHCNKK
jgi:hypothetical protein